MSRHLAWLIMLHLSAACALPSHAQVLPEVFVQRVEEGLRAARASPEQADMEVRCAGLMADIFDSSALAEAVAARSGAALSPPHRTALEDAVKARLTRECVALMRRPDPGSPAIVRIQETSLATRVVTQFPSVNGTGSVLVWSLTPGGPLGMRANDLVADGRSIMALLRSDLMAALVARDNDMMAAITALGWGR